MMLVCMLVYSFLDKNNLKRYNVKTNNSKCTKFTMKMLKATSDIRFTM